MADPPRDLPPLPPLPPLPDDETRTLEHAPPAPPPPPSAPPREERRRAGGDGERPRRRQWSAGHALIVSVLALAIGVLLNAPGVHKSAYNKPDGWQRDVALAFTGPLADVSHALLLDRPRKGVQAVIGRSGADEIDTDIGLPAAPAPASPPAPPPGSPGNPTTPKAPAKVAFSPKKKLRLWVAGDSLIITPGYAIVRAAGGSPAIESVGGVDGRVATGLTRPDVVNWFDEIRKKMKELRPKAVVLGFGGNDDKAYMTGLPEGVSIDAFGGSVWRREYGRRVGGLMDAINRAGGFVIWIGLPQTRSPEQTQRFDVVNAVVQREARKREGRAAFIDTYTMFAGDDGGYTQFLPNGSGGLVEVRADDGVHFEREGGDMIARVVLRELNRKYDLTSWRKQSTS
ncbi:MAG TPA: DUF459 domain-containing protein [Gaiella sp.]|uniref:DUF459 domain-containing protein n=1 Tax=Gaiella sp. TaxID=2663207 RepID=UPI002D7F9BC2|nr:DUF459 domain-containing protein [Gaiella sp.]HET9286404.1 DUF459 domain-containing protein [Gaiella sp.]